MGAISPDLLPAWRSTARPPLIVVRSLRRGRSVDRINDRQATPCRYKRLKQLIEQFDRVIYLLEQSIGIDISPTLGKKMLRSYAGMKGHRYLHAHHFNIPWIFAYMGSMPSLSMYMRRVFDNKALKAAISEKVPGAAWRGDRLIADEVNGRTAFLDLTFCFMGHGSSRIDGEITERIEFHVSTMNNARPVAIYKQTIPIEDRRWSALIAKPRNEYAQKLADKWVPIARDILDPTHDLAEN